MSDEKSQPDPETKTKVVDLFEALKQALEAAKAGQDKSDEKGDNHDR